MEEEDGDILQRDGFTAVFGILHTTNRKCLFYPIEKSHAEIPGRGHNNEDE